MVFINNVLNGDIWSYWIVVYGLIGDGRFSGKHLFSFIPYFMLMFIDIFALLAFCCFIFLPVLLLLIFLPIAFSYFY